MHCVTLYQGFVAQCNTFIEVNLLTLNTSCAFVLSVQTEWNALCPTESSMFFVLHLAQRRFLTVHYPTVDDSEKFYLWPLLFRKKYT